ncbi:MAG: hypothetical protein GY778_23130 [bacterium]|nr:hypothetical protein [bacterium]
MLTDTAVIEENVCIQGQGRMLEGLLAYPTQQASCSALIAGPHPFLGGDMRNNVVSALLTALASQGAVTLAFNYGGVGGSEGGPTDWPAVMSAFWKEGTFQEEQDWAGDAGSALAALQQWCDLPLVLIGYSFGCRAMADNLSASPAKAVILISPNPKQHAYEQLAGCPAPLLLIHSDNDFTCGAPEMIAWVKSIREPKTRIQLSAGEHFFRGHEEVVTDTVLEFLRQHDMLTTG